MAVEATLAVVAPAVGPGVVVVAGDVVAGTEEVLIYAAVLARIFAECADVGLEDFAPDVAGGVAVQVEEQIEEEIVEAWVGLVVVCLAFPLLLADCK